MFIFASMFAVHLASLDYALPENKTLRHPVQSRGPRFMTEPAVLTQ